MSAAAVEGGADATVVGMSVRAVAADIGRPFMYCIPGSLCKGGLVLLDRQEWVAAHVSITSIGQVMFGSRVLGFRVLGFRVYGFRV